METIETQSVKSPRPSRRGVAMFVVLGAVLLVTLLGFAGLTLAEHDSRNSGSILDLKSRDQAAWTGIEVALARMQADPVATATQLSNFLADIAGGTSPANVRDRFAFDATGFSFAQRGSGTPAFYSPSFRGVKATTYANGTPTLTVQESGISDSFAVVLLSVDIGTPVAGAMPKSGITVTLQSTGKGRNGDLQTVVATYEMLGISPQQTTSTSAPAGISNALYLAGDLANSNIGNNIQGDVYVSGNVSLNATAPQNVNGRFRVNGNFTSNAALTVTGDSWIGGNIYTNSGAPMTFQGNLGVGDGIGVMNSNLTVAKSLNVYGSASGSWNTATLRVGQQLYMRDQYKEVGGNVIVGGNAYFGNSIRLRGSATDSFHGFLGVSGATNDNILENGDVVVLGNLEFSGSRAIEFQGVNLFARQNAHFQGPVSQVNSGRVTVDQSAKFMNGITGIGNGIADAFRIGDAVYLDRTNQASFNGGVRAGNMIWMTGSVDGDFGRNTGNGQWSLSTTGDSIWSYQNATDLTGGNDPRVANAKSTNATARNSLSGSFPTLFTAPAGEPYGLTSFQIGMHPIDTITSLAANPPDTFVVSSAKSPVVEAAKVVLSDTLCAAAGASTNNWTAADFNKLYAYLNLRGRLLNGFMVLQIDGSSSLGSISTAGGTFDGKAVFIIEKSINVNGHWPASTDSNAIQVVYVRGSGSLGQFGSQGDIYGLIYYENSAGSLTQSWGANSKLIGAMQFASGASYTGNSGTLSIELNQSVFDKINAGLPNALRTVQGSGAATTMTVTTSSTTVVADRGSATRIQFLRRSAFR